MNDIIANELIAQAMTLDLSDEDSAHEARRLQELAARIQAGTLTDADRESLERIAYAMEA